MIVTQDKLYLELIIECKNESHEILIAMLTNEGFDGFEEQENRLNGYIEQNTFEANKSNINEHLKGLKYESKLVENRNWNEEWELNFKPVIIDNEIIVRADFHAPAPDFKHEIVIQPKMSFGTGHHATTEQMMRLMLSIDFVDKITIDFGCGTGILSILASKLVSKKVIGIDHEDWTIENAIDNAKRNGCVDIELKCTDQLPALKCDIMLANINKNVLVEHCNNIAESVVKDGYLLTSGYYTFDAPTIEMVFEKLGFIKIKNTIQDEWNCHLFQKMQ